MKPKTAHEGYIFLAFLYLSLASRSYSA